MSGGQRHLQLRSSQCIGLGHVFISFALHWQLQLRLSYVCCGVQSWACTRHTHLHLVCFSTLTSLSCSAVICSPFDKTATTYRPSTRPFSSAGAFSFFCYFFISLDGSYLFLYGGDTLGVGYTLETVEVEVVLATAAAAFDRRTGG